MATFDGLDCFEHGFESKPICDLPSSVPSCDSTFFATGSLFHRGQPLSLKNVEDED